LITIIVRAHRRPVTTGIEGMIGAEATALTPLLPEGRVSYGGENWAAVVDGPATSVDSGSQVRILNVEGLLLHVQPVRSSSTIDTYSTPSLE
jgi:membrane-bound serine protease (ClpP class)